MQRKVNLFGILIPVISLLCGCSIQNISNSNSSPRENEITKELEPTKAVADQITVNKDEVNPTEGLSQETSSDASSFVTSGQLEVTSGISKAPVKSPKIIVKKKERILELWDGDALYGSYSIGLGWDPIGDKKKEGDGRTPEGTYYVCARNSKSRFYLSLGVSYPNKEDAREALNEETINRLTYQEIIDSIDHQSKPLWNTALGGEIMIHGMGCDRDWTAGCIAVDNEIMDILWENCPVKTPIIIEP